MKFVCALGLLLLINACSDRGSAVVKELAEDRLPIFAVNKHGTGPLTLVELQINLPNEVDQVQWDKFSKHMRQVLLAQAVVSWAMNDC